MDIWHISFMEIWSDRKNIFTAIFPLLPIQEEDLSGNDE